MEKKRNLLQEAATIQTYIRDHVAEKYPEMTWRFDATAKYYQRVAKAKEIGEQLAWINFAMMPELFWAMDMVPISVEGICALTAQSPERATRYIDLAEVHVPDYLCSANKVAVGAFLDGAIAVPEIFVHPSVPCDSALITNPVLAEVFETMSYFCIDVPYFRDERAYQYIAGELRRLVSFLEEKTGRKLDLDKLRQTVQNASLAHDWILKAWQLTESVPCPVRSTDMLQDSGQLVTLGGTPQLIDYAKMRYETTKYRADKKESGIGEERMRLLWTYGVPVFDYSLYRWLEREYGAISIPGLNIFDVNTLADIDDNSDYDKILRGLAEKVTLMPMSRECGGPWEYFVNRTVDLCKRYKADAAIFGGHIACKHSWAIAQMVKDRLYDELRIPALNLELDVFDPRLADLDTLKAKFDDFLTVVLQK